MSSLRLALKQSLQESGPLAPQPPKGRKRDGTISEKKRKRKPGDPPRKRGRPPKPRPHLSNPQPLQKDSPSSSKAESDEEQSQPYSSEHEFSGDEESESQEESKPAEVEATTPKAAAVPSDDSDEDSKGKKLQKKQEKQFLKDSAAKKIQTQWMKKKITVPTEEEENQEPEPQAPAVKVTPDVSESQAKAADVAPDEQVTKKKKKGKRKDKDVTSSSGKCKTVPAPLLDVLEWSRGIPSKKARKNVSVGLRVKVRFATKVKREGKVIRKKKWYGGRVMGVSKEGSKIKIQYDDGTAEVTKFPDKDIVVDDAFNGEHEADASRFTPRNIEKPGDSETEDDPDLNGGIDNFKTGKDESTATLNETEEDDQIIEPPRKLDPKNVEIPVNDAASVLKQSESSEELPSKPSTDSEETQKISEPVHVTEPTPQIAAPPFVAEITPPAAKSEDFTQKETIDKPMQEVDVLPEEEKVRKVAVNDSSVESKEAPNTVSDSGSNSQIRNDGDVDERVEGEDSGHDRVECEKNASDESLTSTRDSQTKPTLTIRIPNLKRDEGNGTGSRWSPGSDLNPQVDESTEDGSEQPEYPMNPTTESSFGEEKNLDEELLPSKPVTKKRKCDQDEPEQPTKRIQIQRNIVERLDEPQNIPCERQNTSKLETIPEILENEPIGEPESNEEVGEADAESEVHNVETKADTSVLQQTVPPVSIEDEQGTQGSDSSSVQRHRRWRSEKEGHKTTRNFEDERPPRDVSSQGKKNETLIVKEDVRDNKEKSLIDNNQSTTIDEEEKLPATSGSEEASLDMVTPYDDVASVAGSQATPRDKSTAAQPVVRSGRRAAQQANERITSKQEMAAEPAAGKKRKKRERLEVKRRNSEDDSDGTTIDDENPNWVQCDKCSKWRVLPSHVKVSSLPKHWYCENNIYDLKRNSCDAPEQSFAQVAKEKKRGRKRMRYRAEAAQNMPEPSTSEPADKESSAHIEGVKQRQLQRARSPIPGKEPTPAKDLDRSSNDSTKKERRFPPHSIVPAEKQTRQTSVETSEEIHTSEKKGLSNSGKKRTSDVSETTTTIDSTEGKVKRGRGRGRRTTVEFSKDADKNSSAVGASEKTQKDNDSADNLEWVQCEKCEKWRKLPPHISADELPDVWYCALNTWNPDSASCDAPEDKAEGLQDVGGFGGPSTHNSNKLSYRNLIFGSSGKKLHRQISERIRASESIFANPTETTDHPTVMYAQSSAFVPRPRSNFVEETGSMSVFDLMTHSNLWAELRGSKHQISNCTPDTSISKSFQPKAKLSYESLSKSSKQLLKEAIYDVLEAGTLSGGKVYQTIKSRKSKAHSDWEILRCDCNEDVVISALCDMVSCGSVQVVQKISADWSLKDWSPCYRRAQTSQDCSVGSGDSHLRPSRCMKIAKPWKLAQDTNESVEWIR